MKPAHLRPQALADRKDSVRYYRQAASTRIAEEMVMATREALNQIEQNPSIGSPHNIRGQTTVSLQTLSFSRGVGFFSFFRSAN